MAKCKSCNGDGWVDVKYNQRRNRMYRIQKCDECNKYGTDEKAREMHESASWFRGIGSWTKEGYSGDY